MKIMNKTYRYILSFVLMASLTSVNAESTSEKFSQLVGAQPSVQINLSSTMLRLLSSATQEEEDISSLLSALKSIKVTVFEIKEKGNIESIRSEINSLSEQKSAIGYQKLATVAEDDSLVQILAQVDDEGLNSLSIFALDDDDELVLIDIEGSIKISEIGNLMNHFNVDLDLNGQKIIKQSEKD
ncbi:MAG: DUF4252 domain-containing protein [Xanthomonadales bacterium]|jgi:hypothetical protein|nr:DUF4252 domain-containing protein [Xanthomonadales bacterium]